MTTTVDPRTQSKEINGTGTKYNYSTHLRPQNEEGLDDTAISTTKDPTTEK